MCVSLLGTWSGKGTEVWNHKHSNLLQVLLSIQGGGCGCDCGGCGCDCGGCGCDCGGCGGCGCDFGCGFCAYNCGCGFDRDGCDCGAGSVVVSVLIEVMELMMIMIEIAMVEMMIIMIL